MNLRENLSLNIQLHFIGSLSDKTTIPIGKYKHIVDSSFNQTDYIVQVKFKNIVKKSIKDGDIITIDMIEPYESDTVRKVADYLETNFSPGWIDNYKEYRKTIIEDAKQIIKIIDEAEDADE